MAATGQLVVIAAMHTSTTDTDVLLLVLLLLLHVDAAPVLGRRLGVDELRRRTGQVEVLHIGIVER